MSSNKEILTSDRMQNKLSDDFNEMIGSKTARNSPERHLYGEDKENGNDSIYTSFKGTDVSPSRQVVTLAGSKKDKRITESNFNLGEHEVLRSTNKKTDDKNSTQTALKLDLIQMQEQNMYP